MSTMSMNKTSVRAVEIRSIISNYTKIIIIVIIIKIESAVQDWERMRTLYQSEDPNRTQPTNGRQKIK